MKTKQRENNFRSTLGTSFDDAPHGSDHPMLMLNMSDFNFTARMAPARFRNTNTGGSTPNERMPRRGPDRRQQTPRRDQLWSTRQLVRRQALAGVRGLSKIHHRNQTRAKIGRESFCRVAGVERKRI